MGSTGLCSKLLFCVTISGRKKQRDNISVLLHSHSPIPPPPPTKEKEWLDTPNEFISRVKPERKTEEEKNGRGGAGWSEMCFKDGRAPTCCTAPFSCLRTGWRSQGGRTDGRLCGNQRWLQSSTSSNSTAFHTERFQNPCPHILVCTFKLIYTKSKTEIKASGAKTVIESPAVNLRLSLKNVKVCCGSQKFITWNRQLV